MIKRILFPILLVLLYLNISFAATQDRLPTANGLSTSWNGVGSTSGCSDTVGDRWACADDPIGTPDDATTYLKRVASNAAFTFEYANFSVNSTAITSISITARCRYSVDVSTLNFRLRVSGADYNKAEVTAITTDWVNYSEEWTQNPATSSDWTEAEIEGAALEEFGIYPTNITGSEEIHCTQAYITVTYTAVPTVMIKTNIEDWE